MRWDELFDDLEGQFAAAEAAELASEVADRSRREVARLRLVDRIAANVGVAVTGRLVTGDVLVGEAAAYGPDWLLLTDASGRSVLVPTHAVLWVTGLGRLSADPSRPAKVESKLDLRYALRRLVRDRGDVLVGFTDGTRCTGTLLRVGADFVEVSEPAARGGTSRPLVRTVPLPSLAFVRQA
jgi:hypothetical protein